MTLVQSIETLIDEMSLEEKAGQLTCLPAARSRATAAAANPDQVELNETEQADAVRKGLVGSLFNGSNAGWHRRMQQVSAHVWLRQAVLRCAAKAFAS